MRKWILLVALLLVTSVSAALCSDTDGGGSKHSDINAFKNKGEVKYGITSQFDTCLTSENGVSVNSSKWLKEYFCQDDTRNSDVYDCSKNGFDKCEDGECVGGSANSSSSNQSNQTQQPVSDCGDKIVEKSKGEQCDPPGSICFGKSTSEYGSCQADCTCKIAAAAQKAIDEQPPKCGDGYRHPTEDCEEDKDCPDNYLCSSCKCVKQLTAEEIEAMKKGAVVEKEEVVEEKEELPGIDLTPKNFTEEPGIKATSSIANFFRKIFGWIGSLFS